MFALRSLLLTLLLVLPSTFGQDSGVPADPQKLHIFLLTGQSNMAGRGKLEPQDLKTHPRIVMLNKAGEWVPAVDPLYFDKPAIVGVGLGKTFALDYVTAHPEITVGLVPCAVGGSPIATCDMGPRRISLVHKNASVG